ncbi:nucleotidyltransferase domain-containing protein [Massilia horti]|uniref:Nucleotidyltransferase domain-containing protein n=1 Tax=Massilia horti TaxID=2562153 RepID=A0A4Y9SME0_9BURK|nr:nucleotidyltransferase domain-containing protein [Massilia horti]TFW27728.1 nucleotidyltransferase domain-containing protein [Massilia horti]
MNLDEARRLVERQILPRFENVEAAVIGGSIARDQGTNTSDIDLLVLFGNVKNAWRETLRIDGQTVELFGHDLSSFDYFCRQVDRPAGRVPLAMMVIEGKNVLEHSAIYDDLYRLARVIYEEGPPVLSEDALASRRYEITTLLEDLVDSTASDETLATANKLYDVLANFVLRASGNWTGVGKHLARRLKAYSPEIAQGLHYAMTQIVTDTPAGKEAFTQLVASVLHPYGGLLLDGHILHAPPEWKSAIPIVSGA